MFIFKIILSFIIGSFPTGYLMAKLFKKADIRKEGSGNIGATNVWRVVGKIPGIIVLVVDILKGYFVVRFFSTEADKLFGLGILEQKLLLGLAVILGHNFSLFLKFKGGKGVATTAGVIFALEPKIFLLGLVIWIIVFSLFRYVSLASVSSAVLLPVFLAIWAFPFSFLLFSVAVALLISFKHLPNLRRLVAGEELKFRL